MSTNTTTNPAVTTTRPLTVTPRGIVCPALPGLPTFLPAPTDPTPAVPLGPLTPPPVVP